MKKNILVLLLVVACNFLYAQQLPDYKVVFDLTSKDTADQKTVVRWVNGIISQNPGAKVEVVLYGQSLDMVVKDRSVAAGDIPKLTENKNVSFKVCAIAMKKHDIDKSMLLPGVEIVPDGIYEIITKQKDGWGYIKATK